MTRHALHCPPRLGCLALALLLAGGGDDARGQTPASGPTSLPVVNYSDAAFGFELSVPAGWDYDRTRFQQFKDSIGLLRGRGPGGRRGLQIIVFRSFDLKPFEDWALEFARAAGELMNSSQVQWEPWRLPPRAGVILSCASKVGLVETRSHHLCVPFDPSTVWVLTYSGTVSGRAEEQQVRAEFDQIAASLRVTYDPEEAERLTPALERGRELIARLRAEASRVQPDDTEYAYKLLLADKPIGYLTRRVSREEYVYSQPGAKRRYAKEGIRVRERSWRFADDGTVRFTRLDLFSSLDMQSELIESQHTQIPPPGTQPFEPLVKTEQVVREGDVLFSSATTSRDLALPDPSKPISVGPVYLDQAWVRLLPGRLIAEPAEPFALAVYSSETRALVCLTIKPLGSCRLEGYDRSAYAFEVREGFIDRPSRLYCDEHGNLLRLEAGDLTVVRASSQEIEHRYGIKRDEARKRAGLPAD